MRQAQVGYSILDFDDLIAGNSTDVKPLIAFIDKDKDGKIEESEVIAFKEWVSEHSGQDAVVKFTQWLNSN